MTADQVITEALAAADRAERGRHDVASAREEEVSERNRKRLLEESLAQLTTRRAALEELERDRVGLAPGAAALLESRGRFDGAVLGPLSDFLSTDPETAELAERLLGEWMHAVLVRDASGVDAIRRWHAEAQPGAVLLLPVGAGSPGQWKRSQSAGSSPPSRGAGASLGGSAAFGFGADRRAGAGPPTSQRSDPSRRRGGGGGSAPAACRPREPQRMRSGSRNRPSRGAGRLTAVEQRLVGREQEASEAMTLAERMRESRHQAVAEREDAARLVQNLTRELGERETQRAGTRTADCPDREPAA